MIGPLALTDAQKDGIAKRLFDIGVPLKEWGDLPTLIHDDRKIARAVFAALGAEQIRTGGRVVETFGQWCHRIGLPW